MSNLGAFFFANFTSLVNHHHHNYSSIRLMRPVLTLMEGREGIVADPMAATVRKAVRSMDLRVLEFINNHGHV